MRIQTLNDLPGTLRGGIVAIGNFDGVHRGHQAVIDQAVSLAGETGGVPVVALTFEPHPRSVFAPDNPVQRITPAPMKAAILAASGVTATLELTFDRVFAARTAEDFVRSILMEQLAADHVVTGFDFHFGRKREGGPAYLMEAGRRHGFGVTLVDAFRDDRAEVVSSSRIRNHLAAGELQAANDLLGYRFRVRAMVQKGKQLGRTLSYPTANMRLPDDMPLAHGIYAVKFHGSDDTTWDGVASFGRRPTVDSDGEPLLETFVFDRSEDFYGKAFTVSLCAFLRGEEKFDGLDALVAQMDRDSANARQYLANMKPLSALDRRLTFLSDGV